MPVLLILGSHTQDLYLVVFNEEERTLELKNTFRLAESCAWVEKHPYLPDVVYSHSREEDQAHQIFALRVLDGEGKLEVKSQAASGGVGPVSFAVMKNGSGLVVAHYNSSSVTYLPLDVETGLFLTSEPTPNQILNLPFTPLPLNHERQEAPHPHQIVLHPNEEREIFVPDLGGNLVWRLLWEGGADGRWIVAGKVDGFEDGQGPRHSAVHPDGNFLYTLTEMASALVVHSLPPLDSLKPPIVLHTISILPPNYPPDAFLGASEILFLPSTSPSSPHLLLCTNRDSPLPERDAVAVFLVSPTSGGKVNRAPEGWVYGGGSHLRGMGEVGGEGEWVAVLGRTEGGLVMFERGEKGIEEVARLEEGVVKATSVVWFRSETMGKR
ncbi:Lactonase, 7-bladed beta-propeller-domain-containing protein [Mrakia frigida]|uniref:lactonase family protein n=1 Tax=Mrakia frigida TaxID=29902 RepID=UPI003FCC0CFE